MQLNPQQKRKVDKLLKLSKEGSLAITAHLFELEEKIDEEIPQIKNIISKVQGVDGKDGKDGKDGYTPKKGVDYFDGEDGYTPQKGVDYFDGKDGKDGEKGERGDDGIGLDGINGKDGSPDTPEDIRNKLELLEGEDRLDAKAIKNLPEVTKGIVGGVVARNIYQMGDVSLSNLADGEVLTWDDTNKRWNNEASGGGTIGPGTINEIAYFDTANTIASLAVATYPSLTELSYVKGVTSAIQTQINTKANSSGALTQFVGNNTWKVWYSDGSGDVQELALGADGTFLKSNGAAVAPTFATPAGSGDVSKVGTPVNNQVGVWTGDGTLEGDAALTYDSATDTLTSVNFAGNLTGNVTGNVSGSSGSTTGNAATVTTNANLTGHVTSVGNAAVLGSFTKAQLTTAVSDGDPLYVGDVTTNATHTGDATGSGALTVVALNGTNLAALGTGVLKNTTTTGVPFISKVALTEPATAATLTIANNQTLTVNGSATITNGTHSGTNTGDQTSIVGITGTKAQFDTAVTDGNFLYVGDVTSNATHTGDATGATALTLATVNSNVGSFTYGSFTVNAKGLITAASSGATPEVPLTFSTGLTRSTNTITVNTSQNIATLSNLTSNGFVKTSGGTGALSIDTNTYLTTASAASTYQPLDAQLTSVAGLSYTGNAGKFMRVNAGETDFELATIGGGGDALTSGTLAQFAATTSLELKGVISDETGSGALVFATSPTLVTPTLGVASATTINKVALTAPATGSTLTIADGQTLTVNGSATITNGTHSGTNTGDQTSIAGITGTTAQFNTALTDGDFAVIAGNTFTGVHDFGGATSLEIPNGAGGTTVDASGEICVDTTSKTVNFYDGAAEKVLTPVMSKSITIESPTATEDLSMFYTDDAITVTKIVFVITGSTSVTTTIRHHTDRNNAGNQVVTSGTVANSTTTGNVVTSFNDATIPADSFVWVETTALSGTPTSLNITIFYTQDA